MKIYKLFTVVLCIWVSVLLTPVQAGTNFPDVTVPAGDWVNINEVLDVPSGTPLTLQNMGNTSFRIAESILKPSSKTMGMSVPVSAGLIESRSIALDNTWVISISSTKDVVLGVQSGGVTSLVSSGPPLDFETELAAGRIPGKSRILKYGERPTLPGTTGVFATLWDGATDTYVPPIEAQIHDLVSTSIEDAGLLISSGTITTESSALIVDSSATFITDGVVVGDTVVNDTDCSIGIIGVVSIDSETQLTIVRMVLPESGLINGDSNIGDTYRVVRATATGSGLTYVQGLDANRLFQNEFVINNGTTNVPTVKSYLRQTRMRAFAGGSAHEMVGVLTSTAQVDGTVSAQINNGVNQTLMVVQTIPLNKRGFIKEWSAALIKKQAGFSSIRLRVGQLDGISYVSREEGLNTLGTSSFSKSLNSFILPPGIDVWIEADSDGPSMGISGSLMIVLEDLF